MNDCPQMTPDLSVIEKQHQPFTVIMMMPDNMRADECCAADWVRRVWVYGPPTSDGVSDMITDARENLAEMFGWTDEYDVAQRKDTLEPVAIFAGHHFDVYQP